MKYFIYIILYVSFISNARGLDLLGNKYSKIEDSLRFRGLIHASYQYLYIPKNKTFNTGGGHFNMGLNIAAFFSQKFIFGLCLDVKSIKGFLNQKLSTGFKNDFNSAFITTYANGVDSARAYTLRECINGSEGFGFSGNYFDGFGISISPFPRKYGGFLLQIKKDGFSLPLYGKFSKEIQKDKDQYLSLNMPNCYSIELTFNPFRFTSTDKVRVGRDLEKSPYKFLTITLYFQRLTLNGAKFDDVGLDKMLGESFISKYKRVDNFGIKIGFVIY